MSGTIRDESQRQCPACRNWVSHLATRCHFCGETLGRPRKEEVRITVEDLGGESRSQYTVSGNVMDALEAFREENLSEAEDLRRSKEDAANSWFGRRQQSEPPGGVRSDMPALDGEHKSLADDILGSTTTTRTPKPAPRRYDSDLIRNIGIGAAVLGVLIVGYVFVWPAFQTYLAERNKQPEVEHTNNARSMIAIGAPAVEVLQEAHNAVSVAPNEVNQTTLEEARDYVAKAVNDLLNASPFDPGKLDAASALMSQVSRIDHSERLIALAAEVTNEVAFHKFILVQVDADAGKATFKLNNASAGAEEQQVSVGDMLQDRFIVTAIASTSVRLEDTKRQVHGRQRPLVSRPFRAPTGS